MCLSFIIKTKHANKSATASDFLIVDIYTITLPILAVMSGQLVDLALAYGKRSQGIILSICSKMLIVKN